MRPSIDKVMLDIATILAQRATCPKLSVGCVLVDYSWRIIGSGYNGSPRGLPHCIDKSCPGVEAPRGADLCRAVHAEQNALLNCRDPESIFTAYITHSPCMRCVKMLLNTSCIRIIYKIQTDIDDGPLRFWQESGRDSAMYA